MERTYNILTSFMAEPKKEYPADINAYHIIREIGQGSSAIVYKAKCIPFNELVAIKVIDLERLQGSLQDALVCPLCSPHLSIVLDFVLFLPARKRSKSFLSLPTRASSIS